MLKLGLFLLVLNFDSLLSGLALGVAGIRVRPSAGGLVALFSAAFLGAALWLGNGLLGLLPVDLLHKLGLGLLVGLTLLWIGEFCLNKHGGLVGIWRTPYELDADCDKYLSLAEAALLAFALAVDSLGGGLALGLLGQNPLFWSMLSGGIAYVMFMGANLLGRELRFAVRDWR